MGIMGNININTALKVPGVQLVAVCDLYDGRLDRARELYGKDLFVTNDYRKILDRKDIDAVIIATGDHWHARITKEALQKGLNKSLIASIGPVCTVALGKHDIRVDIEPNPPKLGPFITAINNKLA